MIAAKIQSLLQDALSTLSLRETEIPLSHPVNLQHGDYASSITLKVAKSLKKDPLVLAHEIVKNIPQNDFVEKVSVAPPGFINITLSKAILFKELAAIIKEGKNYGRKKSIHKTVLVEYGQPNTHKVPHIGHLFGYVFGETLSRMLDFEGYSVKRLNYQGDIGPHVAKCLYVVKKNRAKADHLETTAEKVRFLQECYQEGSRLYEKGGEFKREIDELNKQIYEKSPDIVKLWEETRGWCLDLYKEFEHKLGITYDKYYFESVTTALGKTLVEEAVGRVFEKSEGAIVFRGEKHNLHTRVFITKHGNPTYEGKEIGLNSLKQKDFTFDISLVATAVEQSEFHRVVAKASQLLFPALSGRMTHIGYGMINLKEGKMSSRSGRIVDAFSLLARVTEEIQETYQAAPELSEKIALAAIKYSFLKSEYRKNIVFDIEKSLAKEGDSGPYLLYTVVRTLSILAKEKHEKGSIPHDITLNDVELTLLRSLYRFPEVVEKATRAFAPHLIIEFLYQLARNYNLFYQSSPILSSGGEVKNFRLTLTQGVAHILRNGLSLLGIETVERM